MSASAERRLEARAAGLTVERLSGRTYRVSSGSGGKPHIVRGAPDQPLGSWQCDCMGHSGRRVEDADGQRHPPVCSHIRAVAQYLMIAERPVRAAQRPKEVTMPDVSPLKPREPGDPVSFVACIPLIQSAVKVAGDGGVRLTIDVADTDYNAVMDFVRQARGRNFRLVPIWETEETNNS